MVACMTSEVLKNNAGDYVMGDMVSVWHAQCTGLRFRNLKHIQVLCHFCHSALY